MGKFTVRIDTRALKKLNDDLANLPKKALDSNTANRVGRLVIAEMKREIESGVSTIKGKGRFPAYKNVGKYPGNRKPRSPVILRLTGNFLVDLKHRVIQAAQGFGFSVGYRTKSEQQKELGHREGANGQRKRPTIPQGSEEFSTEIERVIVDEYTQRINKVLKDL